MGSVHRAMHIGLPSISVTNEEQMVINDICYIMDGKITIMDEQHPCGWKVVVPEWTYPWTKS